MKARIVFIAVALAASFAIADEFRAGDLRVENAHARPTVAGQTSGALYFSIENKGGAGDKLIGVSSPLAKSVELHSMAMDGNIMRMREVTALELKPAERVAMEPGGGYHVMLLNLKQPLKPGDRIPLTLRFEKAGKLDIAATVDKR